MLADLLYKDRLLVDYSDKDYDLSEKHFEKELLQAENPCPDDDGRQDRSVR